MKFLKLNLNGIKNVHFFIFYMKKMFTFDVSFKTK